MRLFSLLFCFKIIKKNYDKYWKKMRSFELKVNEIDWKTYF
jgi:hypothetical protein